MKSNINKLFGLSILAFFFSTQVYAQQQISGIVVDEAGTPIAFVTVATDDGVTYINTKEDGSFLITIGASKPKAISFDKIGYAYKEVPVSQSTSDLGLIVLNYVQNTLEEIVVSALGITQEKRSLGSTYSSVGIEQIKTTGEVGVLNSLAGKASGVLIAKANGDPGAGTRIQIRGANTITGNTQPLIVIDGVPVSNDNLYGQGSSDEGTGVSQQSRLNDINEQDIASINILKGASAAAVWGSLAANGVIVITTKKGAVSDKVNISLNSSLSVDMINIRMPLQNKFGQGTKGNWSRSSGNSWGDKIADRSGAEDEYDLTKGYFIGNDGNRYNYIKNKNSKQTYLNENFDKSFQTGITSNTSLSISGGSKKSTYYASFGYLNQQGIIRNSNLERVNATLSGSFNFTKWIKASAKVSYIHNESNRIQQNSNLAGMYLGLLRMSPDFDGTAYKGAYHTQTGKVIDRQRSYRNQIGASNNPRYNNPLWAIYEQIADATVDRVIGSSQIDISPFKGFNIMLRGGIDQYSDVRNYFFPYYTAGSDRLTGQYSKEDFVNRIFNFDIIGTYKIPLKGAVGANVLIGFNLNDKRRGSTFARIQGLLANQRLLSLENNTGTISVSNAARNEVSNRYYSQLSFRLLNQLFLNLSGAYEVASTYVGGAFYPAVDVSWIFTELEALKSSKVLTSGKLRLSYGQVGVSPRPYATTTTYETYSYSYYSSDLNGSFFGGGLRLNDDQGSLNLKPEIKTEFELGLDLGLLNDRITVGFTYYTNEIKDILLDVSTASSTGYNNIYTNGGRMTNTGFELDFDFAILKKKDFEVHLYGNLNSNKNRVESLLRTDFVELTSQSIKSVAIPGYASGTLYGSRALRDDNGKLILDDNGFPQLDPQQGVLGDPNPEWRGGFGLRGNYKGLSCNILFDVWQGNKFADRTRLVLYGFGTHADVGNEVTLTKDLKNSKGTLVAAGTTVRGNIADFGGGEVLLDENWYRSLGGGFGSSIINEFALSDGSFVRLREISLSYLFNSAGFKKFSRLQSAELGVTARNIALWTAVSGVDPEINQTGVDNGFGIEYFTNPSSMSISFSVRINF